MFDLIILLLVSCIFFVLAYIIGVKGKINLIHSYHYKYVKDEDKKAYAKIFGKGMNVMASGLLITSILQYITNNEWSWLIFCISFVYGLILFNTAQKKYNNGKWF